MKKTINLVGMLFMAVLLCVNFTACSSDDDDDDAEATIVGTWEVTDIDANTYIEGSTFTGEIGNKMTFRSDGTYVDGDDHGKWKKEGNKLTVTSEDSSEPGVVNIPAIFTITQLTRSVMELKLDYGSMLTVVMRLKKVSSEEVTSGSTEKEDKTVGKITINEKSYCQSPKDAPGDMYFRKDYTECATYLYESYPSMPEYSLNIGVSSDCVQGKEVELDDIYDIYFKRFSNVSSTGRSRFDSGKIVCTKKTSTRLELKFSNVKITDESKTSYTLNGTLAFEAN